MTRESALIAALRGLARDPAARGLADDAAVIEVGGTRLVLTHDMIVEGVHFLAPDPPEDVAWKLVAVNLSDLAAKGARPIGALLGYCLAGDPDWDRRFVAGLEAAIGRFGLALLGGDTIALPEGAPRMLGLTAIGEAGPKVPSRAGARPGDMLWVSGTIGDAGAGLRARRGEIADGGALAERYLRPQPRLAAGAALGPLAGAMMDVSDGLLIDAARMAEASGVRLNIALESIPLSQAYIAAIGAGEAARIAAASAGDDYELLFAAAPEQEAAIAGIAVRLGLALTPIGAAEAGAGLGLTSGGAALPLPARLGWEHG